MISQEKVLLYLWVDIQLLTYEVERLEIKYVVDTFGIKNEINFDALKKEFKKEIIKHKDFTKRVEFMDQYRNLLLLVIELVEGQI